METDLGVALLNSVRDSLIWRVTAGHYPHRAFIKPYATMPVLSLDGTLIGAYTTNTTLTPINTNQAPPPQAPPQVQAVTHGISVLGGKAHSWLGQVIIMCPVRVDVWKQEDLGSCLNSTGNEQTRSWRGGCVVGNSQRPFSGGGRLLCWQVTLCNALQPHILDVSLATWQVVSPVRS